MDFRLDGKVAVVTGASRGIGAAIARELARVGASVVVAARGKDALQEVAESLDGRGLAVHTDVSRLEDLDRLAAAAVERFGGIDVLVNNAGVAPPAKQIYKVDPEEWQQTMDINVRAAWYLSKVCHPHMKQRGGGAVVNIASTSGLHHDIGLGIYSISKAAVVMLTTVCAKEWARDHIRVNALAPGIIRTELAGPLIEYITSRDVKPNLMNVIGEPEDIARLVRFLVTDESRLITGDVIRIDAGELL
ncbi:MAG TPA: SDR family oxidoreductase [Candidatus Dormibacteraeota bacterium]|jgi:NAD(P)-dependent dehydrogenase (short-subunit alcohol dehydrogenase family)